VAGVSGEIGADEAGISYNIPSAGSGLSIGGGRPGMSSVMADGTNARVSIWTRHGDLFAGHHSGVQSCNFDLSAQYGVTGGGIISTVSKSGTDEFHGNSSGSCGIQRDARTFGSRSPRVCGRNEFGVTQAVR